MGQWTPGCFRSSGHEIQKVYPSRVDPGCWNTCSGLVRLQILSPRRQPLCSQLIPSLSPCGGRSLRHPRVHNHHIPGPVNRQDVWTVETHQTVSTILEFPRFVFVLRNGSQTVRGWELQDHLVTRTDKVSSVHLTDPDQGWREWSQSPWRRGVTPLTVLHPNRFPFTVRHRSSIYQYKNTYNSRRTQVSLS